MSAEAVEGEEQQAESTGPPVNEYGGPLCVGQPVKVTRAGQWLTDWAEIFRCNPDGTYHVFVKPGIETLSGTVPDKKDVEFGCPTRHQWYIIKNKEYLSEVRGLDPDNVEEMAQVRAYENFLERDGFMRRLVADEEKLRKSTTVKVAKMSGKADKKEFRECLIHLGLTWPIVPAMTKIGGGQTFIGPGTSYWPTWFVHNAKSKEKMVKNWGVLSEAIRQETGWTCFNVYVDGKPLIEDADLKDPGKSWAHEIQRAIVFAANKDIPLLVVEGQREEYDEKQWKALAEAQDKKKGMCSIM